MANFPDYASRSLVQYYWPSVHASISPLGKCSNLHLFEILYPFSHVTHAHSMYSYLLEVSRCSIVMHKMGNEAIAMQAAAAARTRPERGKDAYDGDSVLILLQKLRARISRSSGGGLRATTGLYGRLLSHASARTPFVLNLLN